MINKRSTTCYRLGTTAMLLTSCATKFT